MYYGKKVEARARESRRTLKKCATAERQKKFGFKEAVITNRGECSGCRNPDDNILESECRTCRHYEYFTKEGGQL